MICPIQTKGGNKQNIYFTASSEEESSLTIVFNYFKINCSSDTFQFQT